MVFCCKVLTLKQQQDKLKKQLVKKVLKGNIKGLIKLLKNDIEINANSMVIYEGYNTSLLHIAIYKALNNYRTRKLYENIIQILLEKGADFNQKDQFGHECIENIQMLPNVIRLFLDHGYNGKYVNCLDEMNDYIAEDCITETGFTTQATNTNYVTATPSIKSKKFTSPVKSPVM